MTAATVVLVHGMCGSPEGWSRVTPALERRGIANVAVHLPSCLPASELDDAGGVRAVLDDVHGPVVLVGHSYGGMTLTEVGDHPSVEHLVYLDSLMADVGENLFTLTDGRFDEDFITSSHVDGDVMQFDTEALASYLLRRGWTDRDADEFVLGCRPQRLAATVVEPTVAAWRTVSSTFVSCQDSEMGRDLQDLSASRAGAVVELQGDHFPMWQRPDEVVDIVARIASEVSTV
jgi:pimeloyl-ACP methyl ester carboxylesterase